MSIFKPNVKKMKDKGDVEGLIKALDYQKDNSVREAAARALGEIGNERAVEPLIAALKRIETGSRMREAAAEALGKIGAPAVEPLVATLKDRAKVVREAAAEAMGKIGAPAVEPLIATLKSGDENVREAAAEALESLGWQPDRSEAGAVYWIMKRQWDKCVEIGAPAVEPLIAALKDPDKDVCQASAGALRSLGKGEVVEIEQLLHAHLKRLRSAYQGHPGAGDLQQLCDQLLTGERLSFTVSSIEQRLPDALEEKAPSNATKLFTDWFVAVTVCPWLAATEVRANLHSGYLELLTTLTNSAYGQPGGRHVAHWIYCSDGKEAFVHLTMVPNPNVIRTVAVMAEELLTPDERRQVGLSGEEEAESLEEFAHRAIQSLATITINASDITRLLDVLFAALIKTYPNLEPGEAWSNTEGGLSLLCPNCGQISKQGMVPHPVTAARDICGFGRPTAEKKSVAPKSSRLILARCIALVS